LARSVSAALKSGCICTVLGVVAVASALYLTMQAVGARWDEVAGVNHLPAAFGLSLSVMVLTRSEERCCMPRQGNRVRSSEGGLA
jgi:hypothetical protein